MKSYSLERHFETLEDQRRKMLPSIRALSFDELWERPEENKWSIGETMYHLYLMAKVVRIAARITIPSTLAFAKLRRSKPFETETYDIYQAFAEKNNRGMKAPFVLDPPQRVYRQYNFKGLNQLLYKETWTIERIVEDIDEAVAGHITFFDPVAHHPNLIQAVQLLAIHEAHHFRIMERQMEKDKKMKK